SLRCRLPASDTQRHRQHQDLAGDRITGAAVLVPDPGRCRRPSRRMCLRPVGPSVAAELIAQDFHGAGGQREKQVDRGGDGVVQRSDAVHARALGADRLTEQG
ncbi:MAG: hypothetical protein L0K86_14290, partial [Actinomycetia bacterium]|nr:hypothetical protein [Actinomycetes bacterium]